MNFIKILLIAFGLILLGMLAFPIIGFIYHALWYLFWIAVVGIGGYVGYKILTKDSETARLEGKKTFALGSMDDATRAFEEFKRKHLTK